MTQSILKCESPKTLLLSLSCFWQVLIIIYSKKKNKDTLTLPIPLFLLHFHLDYQSLHLAVFGLL